MLGIWNQTLPSESRRKSRCGGFANRSLFAINFRVFYLVCVVLPRFLYTKLNYDTKLLCRISPSLPISFQQFKFTKGFFSLNLKEVRTDLIPQKGFHVPPLSRLSLERLERDTDTMASRKQDPIDLGLSPSWVTKDNLASVSPFPLQENGHRNSSSS